MTMNYDSVKNQEIKRQFVQREVFACVTSMVEYILSKGYEDNEAPFTMDEIKNMYVKTCSNCGSTDSFSESENEAGETIYICDWCNKVFEEEPEEKPQKIFEWWIVSDWLGEKLSAKGEPVIQEGNNTIWGRTCTGQAILLDGVISEICAEMEILEGQKHEWK